MVDRVNAPLRIQIQAYWGYAVLILRGFLIDLYQLVRAVFFGLGNNLTKKPDERFVPLLDGWVCFFTRHLYGRIEDCWNRPIASSPENWFDVMERVRNENNELVLTGKKLHCLNLGSYNYLGFGGLDPYCSPRVKDAIKKYGVGVCLSPAEHGTPATVAKLERKIADYLDKEDAMIVGMGFATNSWTIPALAEPGCLIISDALNHFSIVEGVKSAGAKVKVFKHNDPENLEQVLKSSIKAGRGKAGDTYVPWKKILIIVEGIYSMEGEMCRMQEIIDVKKKYKAYLYLDEAHSIGAVGKTGRGVTEYFNCNRDDVDIMMGTFTKSFGSIGGYIAGKKEVISALRVSAANYVYSMAMSPACAEQVIAAFELILGEDGSTRGVEKVAALARNSKKFRTGLVERGFRVLGDPDSPVIPLMLYHPEWIAHFNREALKRGVAIVTVGYPATPLMYGRARFCVSAAHTEDDIQLALKTIDEVGNLPHCLVKFDINNPNRIAEMEHQYTPYEVAPDTITEVDEWEPEPLARPPTTMHNATKVASDNNTMQMSRYDFLGLAKNQTIIDACVKTVEKYGCGSCGPRGFYGTVDVHLKLEEDISKFMGVESSIVYSFGLNTISSVIPAFAKPTDLIICDDGVNFAVESGVNLARCAVKYFRHNDMNDLRRVLRQVESEDGLTSSQLRDPRRRRFLVIEGLYQKTGSIAPLKDIVHLKKKYCLRLIMDESMSFGVLGATGRGATEHWGIPVKEVDIISASLECSTASVGGFACGNKEIASHQRLSGSGYTFSASLPPFVSVATSEALKIIDKDRSRLERLAENAELMHEKLHLLPGIDVSGDPASPLMHIRLSRSTGTRQGDEEKLEEICKAVMASAGIELHLSRYISREKTTPPPSIRVCVSAKHSREDIERAVSALETACHSVLISDSSIPEETNPAPDLHTYSTEPSTIRRINSSSVHLAGMDMEKPAKPERDDDDDLPEIWVPFFSMLVAFYRWSRCYLRDQARWGSMVVLPMLERFRNPILDQFFKLASACGSEPFYTVMIPALVWNFPETWYMRSLVFLFGLNVYLGSFLKNLFCLQRPEAIHQSRASQEMLDSRDYAWPSIYCINACSLPFFVLRSMHGNMWLWNQDHPAVTFFNYTLGFAWAGSICLARLYQGAESPSDVQGGMLVGAIVLRAWFTVSDYLDEWVLGGCEGYVYVAFFSVFLLLLHPMPRNITAQASVTFKQACRNVSFMQGFFFGSCLRARHGFHTLGSVSLAQMFIRNSIGFIAMGMTYYIVNRGFRRLMEVVLRKLHTSKTDTDSVAIAKEIIRTKYYSRATVRLAGTYVTFAAIGLCVSYWVPLVHHYM